MTVQQANLPDGSFLLQFCHGFLLNAQNNYVATSDANLSKKISSFILMHLSIVDDSLFGRNSNDKQFLYNFFLGYVQAARLPWNIFGQYLRLLILYEPPPEHIRPATNDRLARKLLLLDRIWPTWLENFLQSYYFLTNERWDDNKIFFKLNAASFYLTIRIGVAIVGRITKTTKCSLKYFASPMKRHWGFESFKYSFYLDNFLD